MKKMNYKLFHMKSAACHRKPAPLCPPGTGLGREGRLKITTIKPLLEYKALSIRHSPSFLPEPPSPPSQHLGFPSFSSCSFYWSLLISMTSNYWRPRDSDLGPRFFSINTHSPDNRSQSQGLNSFYMLVIPKCYLPPWVPTPWVPPPWSLLSGSLRFILRTAAGVIP